MALKILLFGITKEIVGQSVLAIENDAIKTVGDLKSNLKTSFPKFEKLSSLAVAVNNEYAEDTDSLTEKDEIALIPPVSGG